MGLKGKAILAVPGGLCAAAMLVAAAPAHAQAETASAQISSHLSRISEGADSPLGKGDEEFGQLFASWRSLDNGSGFAVPARGPAVSVPSRLPLEAMVLTSAYGMRTHPILRQRRQHRGVDLAAPLGAPVYATADGIVARAERYGSYGNYIQIEHGGELQTRYAHLSAYAVQAGDRVRKGDLIGYVGSTGRSTGPHLHYEVRVAGEAVDPAPYLAGDIPAEQLVLVIQQEAMGGPE